MGTDETVQLLRHIYEAYGKGDMATVFAALADDVEWNSQGASDAVTWGGRFTGKAGVTTFFERVAAAVALERFEVLDIIAQGGRAAIMTQVTVRFRGNDRPLTIEKVDIIDVRGGKVARFCEYYDTAAVTETMAAGRQA